MKEVKIDIPEGYEIDKENSTFECIKLKKKQSSWRNNAINYINGFYLNNGEVKEILQIRNSVYNREVFATEKQAESALAMAQISQIMANDERFGGVITDEEWGDDNMLKYVIERVSNKYNSYINSVTYYFLAFHTEEQRDLFLKENEDLVRQYLMID